MSREEEKMEEKEGSFVEIRKEEGPPLVSVQIRTALVNLRQNDSPNFF